MSEVVVSFLNISTPASVFLAFPPHTACFSTARAQTNKISKDVCPQKVTAEMVAFLNLTSETDNSNFITAYCNDPPDDDTCPFGYCAQPDIAGVLVRASTYVTNICLTLLVFYGQGFEETFHTTLLQLYSILVTAILTVNQRGLTKLHAVTALSMVASPVTIFILIYAIRNAFGGSTRLDSLVGKGKVTSKVIVIMGMVIWLGLVTFTFIPSNLRHFSQPSCESPVVFQDINVFIFAPLKFMITTFRPDSPRELVLPTIVSLMVVAATILPLMVVWFKRNRDLGRSDDLFWLRVERYWCLVKNEYPFLHFMLVIFIPGAYWISTVEIGLIGSNDNTLELSFGQILASFVAIPPVIAVSKMSPKLGHWFMNLTCVRMITGRPQRKKEQVLPAFGRLYGGFSGAAPISFPKHQSSMDYTSDAYENPRLSIEKHSVSSMA